MVLVKGIILVIVRIDGGRLVGLVCNCVVDDDRFSVYIVFSLR